MTTQMKKPMLHGNAGGPRQGPDEGPGAFLKAPSIGALSLTVNPRGVEAAASKFEVDNPASFGPGPQSRYMGGAPCSASPSLGSAALPQDPPSISNRTAPAPPCRLGTIAHVTTHQLLPRRTPACAPSSLRTGTRASSMSS